MELKKLIREYLTKKYEENNKKDKYVVKDKSIDNYERNIRILKEQSSGEQAYKSLRFLRVNQKNIKKIINEEKSLHTQKARLIAVVVSLKAINDAENVKVLKQYEKMLEDVNTKLKERYEEQKATDKEKENWISYKKILMIKDNMLRNTIRDVDFFDNPNDTSIRDDNFKVFQWVVMLSLELELPCRNNVAEMKVINSRDEIEDKKNYILVEKDGDKTTYTTIIGKYKNNKTMKKIHNKVLSDKLSSLLDIWFIFNKSGWLFVKVKNHNQPINSNDVSKYFLKMFDSFGGGKRVSTTMLRKIISTHELKGKPTLEEEKKEADDIENRFQHTIATHKRYRKVDMENIEED